jgi:hypothetical protein
METTTKKSKPIKRSTACQRCAGSGNYLHHGTCFRCDGAGMDPKETELVFGSDWTLDDINAFYDAKLEQAEARRLKREAKNALVARDYLIANMEQSASFQIVIDYIADMNSKGQTVDEYFTNIIRYASERLLKSFVISRLETNVAELGLS